MEDRKVVITIGRQYGSGGRHIGSKLAKDLGISFYDKQIFKVASDESGIGESYFHLADEKAGNKLLYKVIKSLKPSLTDPSVGDDLVTEDNLFLFQSAVIRKLAAKESCVIVGRCADYVLKDVDYAVKIFAYASFDHRLARVKQTDKLDEKDATRLIKKIDKERADYYRYYAGTEWADLGSYDLVIDTAILGLDNSVELIKNYLQLRGLL